MSAPVAPPAVIEAMSALRSAFADIHVMHFCDQNCAPDCDRQDESESAYRRHDEHNFDVRERIHDRAEGLVAALHEWLGPMTHHPAGVPPETSSDVAVPARAESRGVQMVPLVVARDPERYRRWWATDADHADIGEHLEALTDDAVGDHALHMLMLSVFQAKSGGIDWLAVEGLAAGARVRWLSLDIDPAYDGDGVRDGADVVLNASVDVPGARQAWFAVSVYVERPARLLAPLDADPCVAVGEIIDHALALVNAEMADRDAFAAIARQAAAMSAPSAAGGSETPNAQRGGGAQ